MRDLPSFNDLKKLAKSSAGGSEPLRLALLADSSTAFLGVALKGHCALRSVNIDLFEAGYNQLDALINNAQSELYDRHPDVLILFHGVKRLYERFCGVGPDRRTFADEYLAELGALLDTVCTHLVQVKVIVFTFPETLDAYGHFSAQQPDSFLFQVRKINCQLAELASERRELFILDLCALQSRHGNLTDPRLYVSADVLWGLDATVLVAAHLVDIVQAIRGTIRKCVVVDLDNVLWGGVIGDDGLDRIEIGDYRRGKAFGEIQRWLKRLAERGILIAVCSKNTEVIAKEPFIKHPNMVLRLEDIAIFVANWDNKVDNIRHIQEVLGIGFDAMVFIDDSPFERQMVRQALPEVIVPELPEDPAMYLDYLEAQNLFETATSSSMDRDRTRQYREQAARAEVRRSYQDEAQYLASLDMRSSFGPFRSSDIPRLAQLSQRSNQFNLRTRRYGENDIERMISSPSHLTLSFRLSDRFGDYGLAAMVIIERIGADRGFIDTWIMSCRVLGRGMESFVLNQMCLCARDAGCVTLVGEYLPTKKNTLVRELFANLGFSECDGRWLLSIDSYSPRRTAIAEDLEGADERTLDLMST